MTNPPTDLRALHDFAASIKLALFTFILWRVRFWFERDNLFQLGDCDHSYLWSIPSTSSCESWSFCADQCENALPVFCAVLILNGIHYTSEPPVRKDD